jgi:24-methylenesterol C-methyltransferase
MQYSTQDVAQYYSDPEVTKWYIGEDGLNLGWHFRIDDINNTNNSRVDLSNTVIAESCALRPGQSVLDAGCGIGGLAQYLCKHHGVKATGISIVEGHVRLANRIAAKLGLAEHTKFEVGDFMNLSFDDATFDAVVNQETACYANDIEKYLVGVRRVLKKGGVWCSVDGYRSGCEPTEDTENWHLDLQKGWKLPPLRHWRDVEHALRKLDFQDVFVHDLSERVKPYALEFIEETDRMRGRNSPERPEGEMLSGHVSAGYGACKGLFAGFFTYRLIGGRVPL